MIAFDRQEKGKEGELSAVQEFQKNYEIPVYAAATLADLISYLRVREYVDVELPSGILGKILAYRDQYGVR